MDAFIIWIKKIPAIGGIYKWFEKILSENTLRQIVKFLIVGFTVFFIDAFLLWAFTELIQIQYLVSTVCSFIVSTCINYYLSMKFVFKGRDGRDKKSELLVFAVLNLVGLGFTTLLMWIFVDKVHLFFLVAKVFTTVIVMVWSFVSRKVFLEKRING